MSPENVAGWVLAYLAHGLILGALAVIVRPLVDSPAVRCWILRAALFAPLLTATAVVSAPVGGLRDREVSITALLRPHLPAPWREVRVDIDERIQGGGSTHRAVVVRDPVARVVSIIICVLVGAAASGGAAAWTVSRRRARHVLDGRSRIVIDREPFRRTSAEFSTAAGLDVPVALAGGEVCLPRETFFHLSTAEQDSVLLHEMAHVARRDAAWLDAARFVVAVTWWNLLSRRLIHLLQCDTELAADDHAIGRGADPRALVAALATFAARLEAGDTDPTAPGTGVAFAAADSELVARAKRILSARGQRAHARASLAVVLCAACLAAAAVAFVPAPSTTMTPPADRGGLRPGVRAIQVIEQNVVRDAGLSTSR